MSSVEENGIKKRQKELENTLGQISNWEDRYRKIIEMGKQMAPMDESLKTENNLVKACQSQVWLYSELNNKRQMVLQADSDALIVKGLVSIILYVYHGATPHEVLNTPPEFLKTLGLESHLTPSRANGLKGMVQKIIMQALEYERK
jgi:cysteine desulfuration protein SufE